MDFYSENTVFHPNQYHHQKNDPYVQYESSYCQDSSPDPYLSQPGSKKDRRKNQSRDMDMFLVRITYDDNGNICYKNSRPCFHCIQILQYYGIRRVYYTVDCAPGMIDYRVEKVENLVTSHISSGYRATIRNGEISPFRTGCCL
jgi:hypothetical protein